MLFFSGGSALKDVSRRLAYYGCPTVHIITTFDSGGSSAELRRALSMPAVGDLRQRLVTLADQSFSGVSAACAFLERRFAAQAGAGELEGELALLASGEHEWFSDFSPSFAARLKALLADFALFMPPGFDLRGACLGNLALGAYYLRNGRSLKDVAEYFSRLLKCRGKVTPVCEDSVHLAAKLQSGVILAGQHSFTGKAIMPEGVGVGRINGMYYYSGGRWDVPVEVPCAPDIPRLIGDCAVICYPVGSFYSSVLANVRLQGVGRAVAASKAFKIYVPNPGPDPETEGMTLEDRLQELVGGMLADAPGKNARDVLDCLLVDEAGGNYPGGVPRAWCERHGIHLLDYSFVSSAAPHVSIRLAEPDKLGRLLYSLVLAL